MTIKGHLCKTARTTSALFPCSGIALGEIGVRWENVLRLTNNWNDDSNDNGMALGEIGVNCYEAEEYIRKDKSGHDNDNESC